MKKYGVLILSIWVILLITSFTRPFPSVKYYFKNYRDPHIEAMVQLQSNDPHFSKPDTFGSVYGIYSSTTRIVSRKDEIKRYQKLIVRYPSGSYQSDIFEYKSRIAFSAYLDGAGIRLEETNRYEIINFISAITLLFFLSLFVRGSITYLFYRSWSTLIMKPYLILNLFFAIAMFMVFHWISDINDIRMIIILELIILSFIEYSVFRNYTRPKVNRAIVFFAVILSNLAWMIAGWIISVFIMFWFI